jgi:hypothetical protein
MSALRKIKTAPGAGRAGSASANRKDPPLGVETRDLALPEAAWPQAPERAPDLPGPQGPSLRAVEILNGLEDIARLFAVSPRRVRAWERMGAPVYRDLKGVARAERLELWEWFKANCAKA